MKSFISSSLWFSYANKSQLTDCIAADASKWIHDHQEDAMAPVGPGNRKFSLFISNKRTFPPPTLIMSDRHWMARTKGDLNYACCPSYNGISRAIFHRAYVSLLSGRFKIIWHFITAHVLKENLSLDIIYNPSIMLNKCSGLRKRF